MKIFVKLMLLVLVGALAAPFILKGPDGRPLMQLSDLNFGDFELPSFGGKNADTTTVHKWQDENGEWHYSTEAPKQDSETLEIDPNVNVMDAPTRRPPPTPAPVEAKEKAPPNEPLKPSIFNPGSIKEAVDETRDVRDQLEQRQEDIENRLDNE